MSNARETDRDGDAETGTDQKNLDHTHGSERGDDDHESPETWGRPDDDAAAGTSSMTIEELLAAPEIDPVMTTESDGTAARSDVTGQPGAEDHTETATKTKGRAWCMETVDPATRRAVLEADQHRCQGCGEYGPAGPSEDPVTLQVHHLSRDPDHCGLHELPNLTTLCEGCHSWLHKRPGPGDAPVEIRPADQQVLLPYDFQILQVIDHWGPATVSEIASHLYPQHADTAIRERLWTLMGLDHIIENRERQVVDQDAHTGEWVLLHQGDDPSIDRSARGHIPETEATRTKRIEDELVRFLLDHGWDRQVVADTVGIEYRTTFHKERRARAYQIPLSAISRDDQASRDPPAELRREAD